MEEYTCIECENLYNDSDGDTDERMCNKCIDEIKTEKDIKNDLYGTEVYGKIERRDPNIRRSSTVHYPDWDMKKKKYLKVKVPHIHRRGYIIVEKTGEPTTADEHNEKWLNEKEAKS